MAGQLGLRRLDARRSERVLLTWDHLGIEREEIDAPTPLNQLVERELNAGLRVQIQLQRHEHPSFGLSRELSGYFLNPGQAAASDDDLAVALGGEQLTCGATEPGGGARDESDQMFDEWLLSEKGK